MVADAWATALMTLGFDAGSRLAEENGFAALFFVAEADKWERYATQAFDLAIGHD